jgi:signal transduction histidine kinase
MLKKILYKLNFKECKDYNLGPWQCPSFLFVVMGFINIASILGTYIVVSKYNMPEMVVFSVSAVSILIFSVGTSIIHSVEYLVKVDKMKSEFVSIVSHQLKAPLSGMRWSTDILLSGRLGELSGKQEEYLKDIQENTTRMVRLVNDLLDVSKIESDRMEINLQEVDLRETVEDVVKELNFFAKANNTELIVDIDKEIGKVRTDPLRIKIVVQNFIDNAIKYIGRKKGIVKVSLKNKGNDVCCLVEDNGVGISKDDRKRVFDKFFRGNNIAKKQTIGSGLGLYIAKAAIESSGGKIGFDSKEGKGSTFWFTLPAIES